MAMFDTLSFESIENFLLEVSWGENKIPSQVTQSIKESNEFQTKDLDNTLSKFLVSLDGRLKSQHFENYYYENDANGSVIKGAIKTSGEYWVDEGFNGNIKIYDTIDFLDNDWFITFEISFVSGFLNKASCISVEVINNITRKKQEVQLLQQSIKRAKLLKNPIFKFYAGFWVYPMIRFLFVKSVKHPKYKKLFKFLAKILIPFKDHF